jgi:hypothetical protein
VRDEDELEIVGPLEGGVTYGGLKRKCSQPIKVKKEKML